VHGHRRAAFDAATVGNAIAATAAACNGDRAMTPLTSAVVLLALATAVIAFFAWRLHRSAVDESVALRDTTPAHKASALEGALIAGD
jgi:hypothetical protein